MSQHLDEIKNFTQAFDRFQITSIASDPSTKKESFEHYVRFTGWSAAFNDNTIMSPALNQHLENAEKIIDSEIAYFKSIHKNFEWKLYDFNQINSLEDILKRKNFIFKRENSLMFASSDLKLNKISPQVEVIKATSPQDYAAIGSIQESVWNESSESFISALAQEANVPQSRMDVYYAKVDNVPVSCGWIRHYGEISFFFGGSTIKEYRGKGAYSALVQARIDCAKTRGSKYVVSECSPDSERVLKNICFQKAGNVRVYNYAV